MDERSTEDLVAGAQRGERAAIDGLYRRFQPVVQHAVGSWLVKLPRLRPEQEDIEQRTWVRLLERRGALLGRFDLGLSSHRDDPSKAFAVYMSMIAYNTAWREAARKRLLPRLWAADVDADVARDRRGSHEMMEQLLIRQDLFEKVMDFARDALSAEDFTILRGTAVEGRSTKSLAQELGLTVATVQQRSSRIRKKLRPFAEQILQELATHCSSRTAPAVPVEIVVLLLSIALQSSATATA